MSHVSTDVALAALAILPNEHFIHHSPGSDTVISQRRDGRRRHVGVGDCLTLIFQLKPQSERERRRQQRAVCVLINTTWKY